MGEFFDEIFTEENCEIITLNPQKDEDEINFWYLENNKLKINNRLFLDMLAQSGFKTYLVDQDYFFVFINNMVVQEVSLIMIKKILKELIRDTVQKSQREIRSEKIFEKLIDMTPSLFNKGTLEYLDQFEGNFKNDTRTKSFIYFNNCYVEVTEDGYSVHDYYDLDKYIWKAQIIERDFTPEAEESDFKKFVNMVCRFDEHRYNSLKSAIGYLLHTYKDPVTAKAIIFMDEKLEDGSNGGSGKSLLGYAISNVRKSLRVGGKNFKFDRFSFQSYEPGTNIIEFNDLSKNFSFEQLFNIITDNIAIEKKNKDQIIIPFEFSPKVLISTNYTIRGLDESSIRRQFIIEFSDYFNTNYSPEDEFGKRFFDDWSQYEWSKFYMFMIECLQYYLKNGLVEYDRVNLDKKKLLEATSEEFVEFMEDIEINKWYGKRETYIKFLENYPEYNSKNLRQYTLTHWLNTYSKINSYTFEQRRSDNDRAFRLRTIDFIDEGEKTSSQGDVF